MSSLEPQRERHSSFVFNIHNDTIGGSQYNRNSTHGSSAGLFGNIGKGSTENITHHDLSFLSFYLLIWSRAAWQL